MEVIENYTFNALWKSNRLIKAFLKNSSSSRIVVVVKKNNFQKINPK